MRVCAAFSLSTRLFAETWFCSILAVGKSSVDVGTKVSLFSVYLADLGMVGSGMVGGGCGEAGTLKH